MDIDNKIDLLLEGLILDKIGLDIDKNLVWFEKPIEKLKSSTISLFHGTADLIKDTIIPCGGNVGATKYSTPRWSTYYWDELEPAIPWALACLLGQYYRKIRLLGDNKLKISKPKNLENSMTDAEFKDYVIKQNLVCYVYEVKVSIHDVEVGSVPSIREYTLSKPVKIYKTHKIKLDKTIFEKYIEVISNEKMLRLKEKEMQQVLNVKNIKKVRSFLLNRILDQRRDMLGRRVIRQGQRDGKINIGDDLSQYRSEINKMAKKDPRDVFK